MMAFIRENFSDLKMSVAGHGLLLLGISLNLLLLPAPSPQPLQLAIEATVIDMSEIRRREAEVKERQQAQERKQQQAEDARRKQQETDRRQKEEARAAEQRQKEAAAVDRRKEQQRKEEEARIAEQKRKDAAALKRKDEERKLQEAERKRAEEAQQRRQAELASELASELAAEEQRLAAISSGKLAEYLAMIGDRVQSRWVRPASAKPGVECVVHVTQIPGGEVVDVRIGDCNGDAAVVRSIAVAVQKASPMPLPADPSLFDRNLRFTFKPEE
jgi:colicin import membrane protein